MAGLSEADVQFVNDLLDSDDDNEVPLEPVPRMSRPPPPRLDTQLPRSHGHVPTASPSGGTSPFKLSGRQQRSSSKVGPPQKCVQVCLGGTSVPVGTTQDTAAPHFCENLFCISCDHHVVRFADRRWNEATDYLFLRNNYPDKVQPNLVFAPGWCAYCCQCTFTEEKNVRKLAPFSSNWVCRGHHL